MPAVSQVSLWRFLVDENLPARLVGYLRVEGYAAEHAYQDWPREDRMQRILAALRGLAGLSLQDTLVIIEPSQMLVRR